MKHDTGRNTRNHYEKLLGEIMSGECEIDVLPNPSYDFAEERQAMYYSNMRWNMQSDTAVKVMEEHQQTEELIYLRKLKEDKGIQV